MTPTDTTATRGTLGRLTSRLLAPVDASFLAAFRVLYGLVLAISMLRFIGYGWVDALFVEPRFHFKYWGFAWVEPLPGPWLRALFWALGALALAIALGFFFRVSAVLFTLGLAYVELLDVTTYLNHYYLALLLALLLATSPAGELWSVDAWRERHDGVLDGAPRAGVARAWLWLFRFQIAVVYVFAGLAKGGSDWLWHGQPLGIWLGAVTSLPLLGRVFTWPHVPLLFSWGGFLFDTSVVLFLLGRRTRPYAFAAVVVFHALTSLLFPIGMFPLLMVLSALVFFPPTWPRELLRRARGDRKLVSVTPPLRSSPRFGAAAVALGTAYCALQLALPLRHLVYRGNVLWDEQGMRFSWRVMLRAKGGETTFVVTRLHDGHVFFVSPRSYLTVLQESEMSSQPDLILQLAHHVHDDFVRRGHGPVEVRVESRVSLNGRRSVPFIDPRIDLARVEDGLSLAGLVLPPPPGPPPRTRPVL